MKNLNLRLNFPFEGMKKKKLKFSKLVKNKKLINQKEEKKSSKKKTTENFEDITYKEIDGKLAFGEPIYCFCNYVSYGEMVKCDNLKVKGILIFSARKNGSIMLVSDLPKYQKENGFAVPFALNRKINKYKYYFLKIKIFQINN